MVNQLNCNTHTHTHTLLLKGPVNRDAFSPIHQLHESPTHNYIFGFFIHFTVDCSKGLLSKSLGYGIIAGSVLVKVPQILKILSNRSAAGINILAVFLEIFAITLNLSYSFVKGFPFSAWGDASFLAVQTVAIAALVLHYNSTRTNVILFIVSYLSVCYALMGGPTSVDTLWSLQALNIPILIAGKMSQAFTNFSNGSTGQLSAVTCFMLFFGSLARIFTSIQETGDSIIILTYCVSTLTNGIIVLQLLYYWNAGIGGKKAIAKSKTATKAKAKTKKAD